MSVAEVDLESRAADARKGGRWIEAVRLYSKLLQEKPEDPDTICWHAYSMWKGGDLDAAADEYRRAQTFAPKWAGINNCLGLIEKARGNTDAALTEFRAAVKKSKFFADAHANLAGLLKSMGKLVEATNHYRMAVNSKPEWIEMYDDLAVILADQGYYAESNMAVREAIRICPERTASHTTLAMVLSRLDKHDEAVTELRSLIDVTPDNASLWSRLAWVLWRAKRYDEADKAAREAIWRNSKLPYPHFLLGWIATKNEDREAAIGHYQRYLEVEPSDPEGATLALSSLGVSPAPERAPERYMKAIYAKRSAFWDGNVDSKTQYRAPHHIADALAHFMGPRENLDIMDVGCGTGLGGPLLRARARRLDGLDLSAHMIEKAREKNVYDELIEGDLETILRARPGQYDVITSAATLIHFGDLLAPLKACAAALKPGGWMAFTVFPHRGDGVAVLPFYCHSHSAEHIRERADEAGFDVAAIDEKVHEYHDGTPVPGYVVTLHRRGGEANPA